MPDLDIAKFNIPIKIKRAFNKGKIADSYSKMYIIADELATAEARRFLAQKQIEYFGSKFGLNRCTDASTKPEIPEITKEVSEYRNQRTEYHMNNMINMLEMHVTSKQNE